MFIDQQNKKEPDVPFSSVTLLTNKLWYFFSSSNLANALKDQGSAPFSYLKTILNLLEGFLKNFSCWFIEGYKICHALNH